MKPFAADAPAADERGDEDSEWNIQGKGQNHVHQPFAIIHSVSLHV